ncbi:MAG: hypothetical protein LBD75_07795 [Candidatus Peribacteria bacterium]|jgi:hypothetical protein|nr:hypothetical protein [Candidatus Peribacteria bacterium]
MAEKKDRRYTSLPDQLLQDVFENLPEKTRQEFLEKVLKWMWNGSEPERKCKKNGFIFGLRKLQLQNIIDKKNAVIAGTNSVAGTNRMQTDCEQNANTLQPINSINIETNKTETNETISPTEKLATAEKNENLDLETSSLYGEETPTPLPPAPKRYGNEEINEVMDLVKSYNGGVVNGSEGKQRQFANHLLKKIKSLE